MQSNVPYDKMIGLYKKCKMVITDLGGIMEELAFLGFPKIILRSDNERIGLLKATDTFLNIPTELSFNECFYEALETEGVRNYTYGIGNSSAKIVKVLVEKLKL